jgi:membrane protein implicated in regulation of membrane protease activity
MSDEITTYRVYVQVHGADPTLSYTIEISGQNGYSSSASGTYATFDGVPSGSGTVKVTNDKWSATSQDFSAFQDGQTVDVYVN